MNIKNLTFIGEWDEDDNDMRPSWATNARKRLNEIIRLFNYWQRSVGTETATPEQMREIQVLIEEARQTWANRNGGSGWREELDKMDEVLEKFSDDNVESERF